MSFSQPKSPNPADVAAAQQSINTQAAQTQQRLNMTNQQTPFGSLNYAADTNSPSGYSANVQLSPAQQAILNNLQGTQQSLGGTAGALASNVSGMYSNPAQLDPSAITNKLMGWQQQYIQPIFNQQQSVLDSKLANQGLTPGSSGFNNAQNLLARNQGDVTNQFFAQDEPLAFGQEVQKYQLPLQTLQGLLTATQPSGPSFQTTPTEQVQPANYMGAAQQNFQNQQSQFQNTMSGLGQVGGAVGGLFGGGWGGGNASLFNLLNTGNNNGPIKSVF